MKVINKDSGVIDTLPDFVQHTHCAKNYVHYTSKE